MRGPLNLDKKEKSKQNVKKIIFIVNLINVMKRLNMHSSHVKKKKIYYSEISNLTLQTSFFFVELSLKFISNMVS